MSQTTENFYWHPNLEYGDSSPLETETVLKCDKDPDHSMDLY